MSSEGGMREDKETAIGQTETVSTTNEAPARRRGCAGFLRRFWWLILIILAIIALIVVLPVIFVAAPKIIRNEIHNAKLSVQGISATSSQTKSLHLAINSTITSSSGRSATIDGFNASLYLEDKLPHTPFVFIEMPKIHSHKVSIVNTSQEVTIFDEQAFADYNSWYLLNDTFRVTIDGWTHVHVSGLPSTKVHFQKTVNLTGLNSFAGVNITSSTISILPDALGDNFHGFISIPNPSVLTVDIGNASFTNFFNNTVIGQAFIDNLVLFPGNNNLSIRANISQIPVITAVDTQPFCNTGILPLSFIGENITNFGQELPYYEQAFRSNLLSLNLNVGADLTAAGLNVTCLFP